MNFIVDFIDTATQEEITSYLTSNSLTQVKHFSRLGNIYLVSGDNEPPQTALVEVVKSTESMSFQLQDYETLTIPVDDQNWWKIVSQPELPADEETEIQIPLNNVFYDVYLVDSGINSAHPEFTGREVNNLYSFDGDFTDNRGHGTALASLINGVSCAISNARLFNVKVVDTGATITLLTILESLDAILEHSISRPNVPAVANLSWSIPYDEYVNAKIQQLIDNGVAVVVSAGNSGVPISDITPASMPDVFTIGAYTKEFTPADFSNYTSDIPVTPHPVNQGVIDCWAPGVDIHVANKDGGYSSIAGTSASAAIFTAMIVYNVSTNQEAFVTATGETLDQYGVAQNLYVFVQAQRSGILNLPEGYAEYTNNIATFCLNGSTSFARAWYNNRKGLTYSDRNKASEGAMIQGYVWADDDVSSYTISGDAPEGLQVVNGWIMYTCRTDLGTTPYNLYEFTIETTSYDGTISTGHFEIFEVNGDPDILDNIPDEDLNKDYIITLANDCDGVYVIGAGSCFPLTCAPVALICQPDDFQPVPGKILCACLG